MVQWVRLCFHCKGRRFDPWPGKSCMPPSVAKNEYRTFSLGLVENRMWKYSQEGDVLGFFFHLTYVESKQQNNQAGANYFQCLIWILLKNLFTDLDILSMSAVFPHGITLIVLNVLIDCYQPQLAYPTVEHPPARNLQPRSLQTTFDTFHQSQRLLHTQHTSFCVSVAFFFSRNKQYAKDVAFFFHLK